MTQHMEIARHLYELDSFELMARIECPVLFLAALAGPWPTEEKARSLQRAQDVLGSHAQSVWVDGGHDLPVQRPAEVAKAISGFAERVAGGQGA
jgi:pimeloyl-ACP methyl ester carboxylesterase